MMIMKLIMMMMMMMMMMMAWFAMWRAKWLRLRFRPSLLPHHNLPPGPPVLFLEYSSFSFFWEHKLNSLLTFPPLLHHSLPSCPLLLPGQSMRTQALICFAISYWVLEGHVMASGGHWAVPNGHKVEKGHTFLDTISPLHHQNLPVLFLGYSSIHWKHKFNTFWCQHLPSSQCTLRS